MNLGMSILVNRVSVGRERERERERMANIVDLDTVAHNGSTLFAEVPV